MTINLIPPKLKKEKEFRKTSGIFVVFLNIILIKRFGLIGAAWATLISYSLSQIVVMIIDKKSHKFLKMIFNSLTLNIFLDNNLISINKK